MSEARIQTQILNFLKVHYPNAIVWKLADRSLSGIPDILFIHKGRVVWFEVKIYGKKPTEIQKYVGEKLKENGVEWYIVHSVDECKERLYEKANR